MGIVTKKNAGTGEQCECGNHREKCLFGRNHMWQTPFYKEDDSTSILYHTFCCSNCRAECLRTRHAK